MVALTQLVRVPVLWAGSHGFEPHMRHFVFSCTKCVISRRSTMTDRCILDRLVKIWQIYWYTAATIWHFSSCCKKILIIIEHHHHMKAEAFSTLEKGSFWGCHHQWSANDYSMLKYMIRHIFKPLKDNQETNTAQGQIHLMRCSICNQQRKRLRYWRETAIHSSHAKAETICPVYQQPNTSASYSKCSGPYGRAQPPELWTCLMHCRCHLQQSWRECSYNSAVAQARHVLHATDPLPHSTASK